MRGKDLNIAPGETAEVRLELSGGIANRADPLGIGKEGEVENALPRIQLAPMNKVSEISHPGWDRPFCKGGTHIERSS